MSIEHMTPMQMIEELEIITDRVKNWYGLPIGYRVPRDVAYDAIRDARWLLDFINYTLDLSPMEEPKA